MHLFRSDHRSGKTASRQQEGRLDRVELVQVGGYVPSYSMFMCCLQDAEY